ncbi:NAD(P)H-dependent oxidoreductase [Bacillus pseudomycoides]|uniref:NAD(P)H-dependent oxidoreductase n=1 Tax=Bacillus pseudomycoides TaxID=64104 RepID=A0A2B5UCD0_9BACI|nr:NAD(P)H-dependent oxidoreductase [Bacillus pseudomycoides]PDY48026.1 NAD(P)H-dependent oxidoreductase [Bacillus pseudomycoides]PEA81424.1 NAD(P)H-dependent oxidoreductase [Bacillus pseudomycoides]PED06544.1 NAD(P)H-dependent oxidoreductase [Bacillus pseudomycoides]PEI92828.1 NAD(P)H-dependent oxidoreductase [Bacillus pseudomycoides]PEK27192.1 NAD(P)H-dependent oxidoreductase [Bacillus pseudomycoides]
MEYTKEEILKAYHFRHACKEFDVNKKVSDEDFHFILETGRLSPSSFGFEPWRFVVIQNQDIRNKLLPVAWGAQKQLPTASHFVAILARKKEDMIYDSSYISNFMKNIQQLPEEVITMKRGFYKAFQETDFQLLEGDRAMFDWASKQTYIALGNMMTAAAQIGIDSCPIEGFHQEKVEAILKEEGIVSGDTFGVSALVAFGYRAEEPKRDKTRQTMDMVVEWIK